MGPLRLKVATGLDIVSCSHDDKREREREMGRCWCLELGPGLSHHHAVHRALVWIARINGHPARNNLRPDSSDVSIAALGFGS